MNTNTSPGTGAIVGRPGRPIEWMLGLAITVLNGSGATIKKGNVVRISGDKTVSLKTTSAHIGIGFAEVDIPNGEYGAVVPTLAAAEVNGIAKGGSLSAGGYVRADGTMDSATGLSNYVVAASTEKADGIVFSGNTAGGNTSIFLLNSVVTV